MSDSNRATMLERVIEVTGANEAEAKHLLAACGDNVEAAVALYFEQGGGVADEAASSVSAAIPINEVEDDEEAVRAPIAPIREQLIGPEDDNFFTATPPATGRLARVSQRMKICPLRDFAREGALMEEQLQVASQTLTGVPYSSDSGYSNISQTVRRTRAATMMTVAQGTEPKASSSRLGDLFRPPTDIAYAGTFQAARMRSTDRKRWLLVNVQSDNFDSQLLNRDVWSDKQVRKLLRMHFILWQVDADNSEGRRFVTFYHCVKLPYVCIIDPRTGEEVWKSTEPKQSNLLLDLGTFLSDNRDFDAENTDDTPSTSKRANAEYIVINVDEDDESSGVSVKKRSKLLELSEEEQIALAIRNSMQENGATLANACEDDDDAASDFSSIEEFGENEPKEMYEQTSYEQHLGAAKNELTALKLRLLNVDNVDEVMQLRWPSDTQLKVLRLYIKQHHDYISKRGNYKLICAFPRKTLESEHDCNTLKELGLHPSANIHITLDD